MAACARPRSQWRRGDIKTFNRPLSPSLWEELQFRCGKCAPCLLHKSADWMQRLTHEGYSHKHSTSLCLTYSNEHLPAFGSLSVEDWDRFINSLRKRLERRGHPPITFDVCGEYSPAPAFRPHMHAALFGYWPPDAKYWAKSRAGNAEYVSEEITALWGKGRATFQEWTHGAASYIAGHQSAKLTSRKDLFVIGADGSVIGKREPEFHRCSTRPGIGRRYFEQHGEQALKLGFVVAKDRPVSLSRYYMRRGKFDFPELAEEHAQLRRAKAIEASEREDQPSLESVEFCAQEKIRRASRKDGL